MEQNQIQSTGEQLNLLKQRVLSKKKVDLYKDIALADQIEYALRSKFGWISQEEIDKLPVDFIFLQLDLIRIENEVNNKNMPKVKKPRKR